MTRPVLSLLRSSNRLPVGTEVSLHRQAEINGARQSLLNCDKLHYLLQNLLGAGSCLQEMMLCLRVRAHVYQKWGSRWNDACMSVYGITGGHAWRLALQIFFSGNTFKIDCKIWLTTTARNWLRYLLARVS